MRDQRLYLHLGEVDADTNARPAAKANQRVWRFVLLARRCEAIWVEPIRVGEDCRDVVRASDRVEYMRAGWDAVAGKLEIFQHAARPIRHWREESLGLTQRVFKQLH